MVTDHAVALMPKRRLLILTSEIKLDGPGMPRYTRIKSGECSKGQARFAGNVQKVGECRSVRLPDAPGLRHNPCLALVISGEGKGRGRANCNLNNELQYLEVGILW